MSLKFSQLNSLVSLFCALVIYFQVCALFNYLKPLQTDLAYHELVLIARFAALALGHY